MTEYFVWKDNGNDSWDGLAPAWVSGTHGPWATIAKANVTLIAGDKVYIRVGEYYEPINPANSGTALNPIIYARYQSEVVIIADIATGATLAQNYIVLGVVVFTGRDETPSMTTWFMVTGSHNTIDGATALYASDYGGAWIENSAAYTKILNATLHNLEGPDNSGEVVRIEGNHTLLDGCTIYYGTHNCIGVFGDHTDIQFTIIQNCDLYNPIYRAASWGMHDDHLCYLLFQDNRVHDCRSGNIDETIADGVQTNGGLVIFRRNLVYHIDGCGLLLDSWPWEYPEGVFGVYKHSYTKAYNNVFFSCGENTEIEGTNPGIKIRYRHYHDTMEPTGLFPNGTFLKIGLKNNILRASSRPGIYYEYDPPDDETSPYDVAGNWLDADGNPLFVSESGHDFHLQVGSPCRNNGVFLTTITSASGSGTSFIVADAGYFCDGWGMIEGDEIQIEGRTARAIITNVDYSTNNITVDTPLTWLQGEGVALAYNGSAPDQGAYEYEEEEEHSGSAVISGKGSIVGTIQKGAKGSILNSGKGTLLALGMVSMLGFAEISSGGSQIAVGQKTALSSIENISGSGSIIASGRKAYKYEKTISESIIAFERELRSVRDTPGDIDVRIMILSTPWVPEDIIQTIWSENKDIKKDG